MGSSADAWEPARITTRAKTKLQKPILNFMNTSFLDAVALLLVAKWGVSGQACICCRQDRETVGPSVFG
jgi:hypothetical protein